MNKRFKPKCFSDGCMLLVSMVLVALVPVIFFTIGGTLYSRNSRAVAWPQMEARITGSKASGGYLEDSDHMFFSYFIDVKLTFAGHVQGQVVTGSFTHTVDMKEEATEEQVEKARRQVHETYDRSGLLVHVNPENPHEYAVGPTLTWARIFLALGVLGSAFFLAAVRKIMFSDS